MSGIRIGLIGPLPPPAGGMANQTRQLLSLLDSEGLEVTLVQTNKPYTPGWIAGIPGIRAVFRLIPYLATLWRVAREVQLFHVMANSGWAWHLFAAPAILIGRLRGVSVMINYRGGEADGFLSRSLRWVRPVMNLSQRCVVPTGFLVQVFNKYDIATEIVPNIVDLDRFSANLNRPDAAGLHMVSTRNLEKIYDIATAIRAFNIIHQQFPNSRLSVAGTGPERSTLEALVNELGLNAVVVFTGRLAPDEMAALYTTAHVMLNSSVVDNTPNSILEAMASGVPVISSNVGGIPYLVEHERTALLVSPGSPEALAEQTVRMLSDETLYQTIRVNALQDVQKFTWEKVRPVLLGTYQTMIDSAT